MTNTFESVIAWQKARQFILHVYKVTKGFPDDEKFGLTSQFRRAAVSIVFNYLNYFNYQKSTTLTTKK